MKWPNVKLIFFRELRDQLRDRRTLFTVAVMPLLLYPLMGMAMLQVGQFMREYPAKVLLIGEQNLPQYPALITEKKINPDFASEKEQSLLEFQFVNTDELTLQLDHPADTNQQLILQELNRHDADLAVCFFRSSTAQGDGSNEPVAAQPLVQIFHNSASDKSKIGADRFSRTLSRWKSAHAKNVLTEYAVPPAAVVGLQVQTTDIAEKSGKRAALWSKIYHLLL